MSPPEGTVGAISRGRSVTAFPVPKPPARRALWNEVRQFLRRRQRREMTDRLIQGERIVAKWNSTSSPAYLSRTRRRSTRFCTEVVSMLDTPEKSKTTARRMGLEASICAGVSLPSTSGTALVQRLGPGSVQRENLLTERAEEVERRTCRSRDGLQAWSV